jgi:hypothetical protein
MLIYCRRMISTLKVLEENIVFGGEFDEERYKKGMLVRSCSDFRLWMLILSIVVLDQCALNRDLELFEVSFLFVILYDNTVFTYLVGWRCY